MTREVARSIIRIIGGRTSAGSADRGVGVPLAQSAAAGRHGVSLAGAAAESVRKLMEQHWLKDVGIRKVGGTIVAILVDLDAGRTMRPAEIDRSNETGDVNWGKFADSCRRAVLDCSPLRVPAHAPCEARKHMMLVFAAREMLGP